MSHALTIVKPATLAPRKERERSASLKHSQKRTGSYRPRRSEDGKCGTYASR